MDPKTRFSNRVALYKKYRPDYPVDAIDYLHTHLDLEKKIIADIGSGTGIFSRSFLERGSTVYAVEPNREMRKEAESCLSEYENFISIDGSAENTTLRSCSVDCIACAQAFHWFDLSKTKQEFLRILGPGAPVVLVWNRREGKSDFAVEYETFLCENLAGYSAVSHSKIDDSVFNSFFVNYEKRHFYNNQLFDLKGYIGRVFSSSYTPIETDENYPSFFKKINELFAKYQKNGKIEFIYETEVVIGKLI